MLAFMQRKQLRKANEKVAQQSAPKANHKGAVLTSNSTTAESSQISWSAEALKPKDAKEVAKKLLSSGVSLGEGVVINDLVFLLYQRN